METLFFCLAAEAAGEAVKAPAELFSVESLIALLTLTGLEIVLGIDNVIFIAILSGKLPPEQRGRARNVGLMLAVVTRILLLLCVTWLMKLTTPLFPQAPAFFASISGKDLILILGGLFLVGKASYELHDKLESVEHAAGAGGAVGAAVAKFGMVVAQIVLIDIVFSLDSVITAVGMSGQVPIMMVAVILAAVVMVIFARTISEFVEKHPTLKVLALSFLILIGVMLFIEGFGHHVPKGYIYFAMAYALGVEMFNMKLRKRAAKVHLHNSTLPPKAEG